MPPRPTPSHKPSLQTVLDQVSQYLESEIDAGLANVELSREVIAGLLAPVTRRTPAPATAAAPVPVRAITPEQPARPVPLTPPTAAASPAESSLAAIANSVAGCRKCVLHEKRTKTVPGQGNSRPEIMFIGEGPGAEEDLQGLAFVGAAGQLLTKMIEAMGYRRDEVFIGNIVKCRPPNNRKPAPEEMEACMPYLLGQISLLKPRVIIALGATAVEGLLKPDAGITKIRGHWHTFNGIDVMPTFHPAYLLRNPPAKREVWDDLKSVLQHLGRPVPKPARNT